MPSTEIRILSYLMSFYRGRVLPSLKHFHQAQTLSSSAPPFQGEVGGHVCVRVSVRGKPARTRFGCHISYRILSYLIKLSYPILSYRILSYPILSYLIRISSSYGKIYSIFLPYQTIPVMACNEMPSISIYLAPSPLSALEVVYLVGHVSTLVDLVHDEFSPLRCCS